MSNSCEFHTFDDSRHLDEALAQRVAELLWEAIKKRVSATIAVSGGSTPVNFFRLLSSKPLPWKQVLVTLADERWVPPGDSRSNEKLVRDNLLVNQAGEAQFCGLWSDLPTPEESARQCNTELVGLGMLDVIVLGMGEDGHTASLFPGSEALRVKGVDFIAVEASKPPPLRITMSFERLLNSRHVFVHITGISKKAVLESALANSDGEGIPIGFVVRNARRSPEIFWCP